MTYASYDDLVTRFGETRLAQLTDRATPPARRPDRAVIEAALVDASEAVDGYAAARYLEKVNLYTELRYGERSGRFLTGPVGDQGVSVCIERKNPGSQRGLDPGFLIMSVKGGIRPKGFPKCALFRCPGVPPASACLR